MQEGSKNDLQETVFSLRGKFTPPNDKVVRKVTVPRKKTNKPVFPRERAKGRFPRGGS